MNVTEQAMASGQLDFATSFFSALYQQKGKEENLLVSPFSLHCALGMLSNGANGETRDAILRTMGMEGYSQDEVNDYFQKLMEGLNHNPFITIDWIDTKDIPLENEKSFYVK